MPVVPFTPKLRENALEESGIRAGSSWLAAEDEQAAIEVAEKERTEAGIAAVDRALTQAFPVASAAATGLLFDAVCYALPMSASSLPYELIELALRSSENWP